MIKTILSFILSCIRVSFDILRIAIIKALLPTMPLPNWRKEYISVVQVDDAGQVEDSRIMMKGGDTRYTNVNVTPTKFAVVEFEFSIYPDFTQAPQDTRNPFLTPVRPPIREVGLTILRNASERVSEILQENRRRLDAGEDPNTIRKEARRKRAMELSAARKGGAKLFSLA